MTRKKTETTAIAREVEIKCVAAEGVDFVAIPQDAKLTLSGQKQLNWYYEPANLLGALLGKSLSARLRTDDSLGCTFILKSGADPVNGRDRQEFEMPISDRSAAAVEKLLLSTGMFHLSSRWARVRDQYSYGDFVITYDVNSGYSELLGAVYEIEGPSEEAAIKLAESMGLRVLRADELKEAYDKVVADSSYYERFVTKL